MSMAQFSRDLGPSPGCKTSFHISKLLPGEGRPCKWSPNLVFPKLFIIIQQNKSYLTQQLIYTKKYYYNTCTYKFTDECFKVLKCHVFNGGRNLSSRLFAY